MSSFDKHDENPELPAFLVRPEPTPHNGVENGSERCLLKISQVTKKDTCLEC